MSHLFGPLRQLGYVVERIDTAIDFWIHEMGCGPVFYFRSLRLENHNYRGQHSAPEISLALVQNGGIQVELVQQNNQAASSYRNFLREHGEGLHHLGYWTERFEHDLGIAENQGRVVEQYTGSGKLPGVAERVVHFAPKGHPGTVIELSEMRSGGTHAALFRSVAQESLNWTGIDPIRCLDLR
jgi:hypothetical protein